MVLLCTSLPSSFAFQPPSATPVFAFGLCNLALESLTRRVSEGMVWLLAPAGCTPYLDAAMPTGHSALRLCSSAALRLCSRSTL